MPLLRCDLAYAVHSRERSSTCYSVATLGSKLWALGTLLLPSRYLAFKNAVCPAVGAEESRSHGCPLKCAGKGREFDAEHHSFHALGYGLTTKPGLIPTTCLLCSHSDLPVEQDIARRPLAMIPVPIVRKPHLKSRVNNNREVGSCLKGQIVL
jgi:hypothetical protein